MVTAYEQSLSRAERKARGIFYTPPAIVDYIVDRCVRPGDSVLDLACGAGAFLVAALRKTPHVTGIDVDAEALKLAAAAAPGATLHCADALFHPIEPADVVIGNPPYLSIDDWGLNTGGLRRRFAAIYRDKTDLSYYFLARAVELCRRSTGFIISRSFLEAYKADRLREFLSARVEIREIVDLADRRPFDDAGIGTCIVILDKRPTLVPGTSAPWTPVPAPIAELNAKIDAAGTPVGDILIVGQGMQTGRNSVFGRRSAAEMTEWKVPPALRRKRAANSDIQPGWIRDRGEHLLYLEEVARFDDLPEGVRAHLLAHEAELKSRAAYRRGDCEWWKYTWPLHKSLYHRKRILCPFLASSNRFAVEGTGEFLSLTDTTVLFDNGQEEDLEAIAALLNSKLLSFRFRTIGKHKGNGIREYFWNGVARLPIRRGARLPLDDAAVYALYGLTPAEIALVESAPAGAML